MATATRVWVGNETLRRALVPAGDLRPHPRNPRRGNVDAVAGSLERFGQQRPILALPDGTIVAGHHVFRAAAQLGWTHVAVVRSDLTDSEVEAYLLADNRTSDLGVYDDAELLRLLEALDSVDGTGYTDGDISALTSRLLADEDEQFGRLGAAMKDHVQMAFIVPADGVDDVNDMVARVANEAGDTSPGSRGRALVTVARRLADGTG